MVYVRDCSGNSSEESPWQVVSEPEQSQEDVSAVRQGVETWADIWLPIGDLIMTMY